MAPSLMIGDSQRKPDGVDADRDGVGDVELVVGHDAGDDEADEHVEQRADRERAEDADRHVALGVDRLLRCGRDGVESDVGEEDDGGPAHDAAPSVFARRDIGWNERALRVGRGHPVRGRDVAQAGQDERDDDRHLDDHDDVVDLRRFMHADDQQRGYGGDDDHGRHVKQRARRRPGAGRGIVGERRIYEAIWQVDADIVQEARDITRPADRDGGGAERILEDEVPADDPGNELAHRRIRVRVGAARDRNGGGHLGVA